MVVFQYNLDWTMNVILTLPSNYQILNVGIQNDKPVIWILVNPVESISVQQLIIVVPTGYSEVPENATYINTLQKSNGYVAHFFKGEIND